MSGNPDSGMREIFGGGIQNPGPWNLEYSCRNPESGIQDPLKKILNPVPGIRNPSFTEKDLESGIHGVESKLQDCLGFSFVSCFFSRPM